MKNAAAQLNSKTSKWQDIARYMLGLMLLFTGSGHLTWAREEFTAQVPEWVPMNTDMVVVLSGIAELAIGICLIFLMRYKVAMGWVAAIFFVVVFPGNIAQYVNHTDAFGLNSDLSRGLRLFVQPVFVVWALWSTNAWRYLRNRKRKF